MGGNRQSECVVGFTREGALRRGGGLGEVLRRRFAHTVEDAQDVPFREPRMRRRRHWVTRDGGLEGLASGKEVVARLAMHQLDAAQGHAVGVELLETGNAGAAQLDRAHHRRNALHHLARELALHGEYVGKVAVEALAPDDAAVARVGELRYQERARLGRLYAAGE